MDGCERPPVDIKFGGWTRGLVGLTPSTGVLVLGRESGIRDEVGILGEIGRERGRCAEGCRGQSRLESAQSSAVCLS